MPQYIFWMDEEDRQFGKVFSVNETSAARKIVHCHDCIFKKAGYDGWYCERPKNVCFKIGGLSMSTEMNFCSFGIDIDSPIQTDQVEEDDE